MTIPMRVTVPSLVRRWRVAVALVAASACLSPAVAAQGRAASRGFIWSVERDGHTNWLVGSLHVLPADAYPLPQAMEQAFGRARTLMEEIDVNDATSLDLLSVVMAKGMFSGGESLQSVLPPATYDKLAQRVAAAGLPIEAVAMMRPWMAENTLSMLEIQKSGFDPDLGVDVYYRRKATEKGVTFAQLETAAEQIDYLANVPMDVQVAQLKKTLDEGDAEIKEVQQIAAAWRAGDGAAIERLLLQDMKDSRASYESLVVNRNRRWVPRLESCFSAGNCFVVVGAAHMVGGDGLIAMLRQKGYRITQQ
jgi:uncharacterized protein YbaP (TraB family)